MARYAQSWMVAVLVLVLLAAGCSGSGDSAVPSSPSSEVAAAETATATAAPVEVSPTASTEPPATPLPTPEPTATAEPEQDPLLAEAEELALEWQSLVTEFFADPLNMDISRMIQIEAGPDPEQPMTDWTLRSVAILTAENRYQPVDGVRAELMGSQWDPQHPGRVAWVDVCIQTGGVWFDIDTDEEVMRSWPDPWVTRYRILTDSMQLAAVSEEPTGDGFVSCEFTTNES